MIDINGTSNFEPENFDNSNLEKAYTCYFDNKVLIVSRRAFRYHKNARPTIVQKQGQLPFTKYQYRGDRDWLLTLLLNKNELLHIGDHAHCSLRASHPLKNSCLNGSPCMPSMLGWWL